MSCDYTDIIMPIDYTPEAFEFANRKLFHKWKMIGMQVSHPFVGGIQLGTSGEIARGVATGCRVIEEVNQNNHIVGRGTWYFRAKSDAPEIDSAAYGIIGHCTSPGVEDVGGISGGNGLRIDQSSPFVLEEFYGSQPIWRGWGLPLGPEFCACGGKNSSWHMGVFIRDNNPTEYERNNIFFIYDKDDDPRPGEDPEVVEARNSRKPGRFNAWLSKSNPYRTCEAFVSASPDQVRLQGNYAVGECIFAEEENSKNGITNSECKQSPIGLAKVYATILVKLTSLPSCNNFTTVYKYPPLEEDLIQREISYRCERAALRILPSCRIDAELGTVSTKKYVNFESIEKHYDRWDRSDTYEGCYKIFDEIFEIPELNWTVRILSHNKRVLTNWWDVQEYGESNGPVFGHEGDYIWENAMEKQFLTGGKITDLPSGMKGCTCTHKNQNEDNYPIRPYNQFNYCPNNFTCEKTCYD